MSSFPAKTQCITTPSINIFIDECDSVTKLENKPKLVTSQSFTLFKCKSMLNINKPQQITRLDPINDAKFKSFKNLVQISKKNDTFLQSTTNVIYSSSRQLARKCVSRLNLNNKTTLQQDLLQPLNGSVSIMNLANKPNRLYFKSSNFNLYNNKSSTSLNALLDLEMFDSVSLNSFDRYSLYSQCCASECDLSAYYLIGSTADLLVNDIKISSNKQSLNNDKIYFKSNNNKVVDWLQKN